MLRGWYCTLSGIDLSLEKLFVQKLNLGTSPHSWPKSIVSFLSVTFTLLYGFGLHFLSEHLKKYFVDH